MGRITVKRRVTRVTPAGDVHQRAEVLPVEEELTIEVEGRTLATVLRTPGHDRELAAGMLVTRGVITRGSEISMAVHCDGAGPVTGNASYNILDMRLAVRRMSRGGEIRSAGLDGVEPQASEYPQTSDDPRTVTPEELAALLPTVTAESRAFGSAGALPSAALIDPDGTLAVLRDDVSLENAVDKVIGWAAHAERLPLTGHILVIGGIATAEILQRTAMANVPVIAATASATSLAIDRAAQAGATLIGGIGAGSMTVFTGEQRLRTDATSGASASSTL